MYLSLTQSYSAGSIMISHGHLISSTDPNETKKYISTNVPNQRNNPAAKGRANDRRLAFLLAVEGLSSLFGLTSITFLRLFISESSLSDPAMAADNDFLLASGHVLNNLCASELSSSFCDCFLAETWFTNC